MYTDFYGFSDEPFSLNPDPRSFFLARHHRQVFTAMVRGISHRRGVILLTGERGVGKTAFLAWVYLYLSTRGRKKVIPLFRSPDTLEEILL